MSSSKMPEMREASGELEVLMERYQQSHEDATATLVAKLSPRIFQFYLSQTRDRSQSEDLLQEFWLRLHRARQTYRPGEPLLPWVFAIARRVRVDQYRKKKSIYEHEVQSDRLPDLAGEPIDKQNLPKLADLLKTLPASQQEVIVMLKVLGLSLEEVARATGSSVGSVKQKAHRAYEKLRAMLGGER